MVQDFAISHVFKSIFDACNVNIYEQVNVLWNKKRWLWVADKEILNKDRSLTKNFTIKFINNINKQQLKIHKNHFAVFDTSLLINQ